MQRARRWLSQRADSARDWAFWSLPRWLCIAVALAVLSDLAAIGVATATVHFTPHDLVLFGLLVGCIAVTVELTRQVGENTGRLDASFEQLIKYLELERETRRRISTATRYPMLVVSAVVGMCAAGWTSQALSRSAGPEVA